MEGERRSTLARLGIVALNLLTPGLGLVRVGRLRAGLGWMALIGVIVLGLLAYFAIAPELGFVAYMVVVAFLLLVALTSFAGSKAQTWRASAIKGEPIRWWSRWYALVGLWLLVSLVGQGLVEFGHHRYYKPFYIPGEAMTPTLALNDRLLVRIRPTPPFQRGEVIVFEARGEMRIDRILGLPGDRVAIRRSVPFINGQSAIQRPLGDFLYDGMDGPTTAHRLEERFPGEARSHFILDFGYAPRAVHLGIESRDSQG